MTKINNTKKCREIIGFLLVIDTKMVICRQVYLSQLLLKMYFSCCDLNYLKIEVYMYYIQVLLQ